MPPKLIRLKCSEILTILDVLRNYPIVWNVKLKEYSNKSLRDGQIQLIILDLARKGLHMTADEFRLRMKNIKDTYRVELNKVKMSKKAGGIIYVPKLIWYKKADMFLREVTCLRMSSSKTETRTLEINDEPASLVNNSSSHHKAKEIWSSKYNHVRRKRDDVVEEAYNILKLLSANMKNRDEFDTFGKHVACSIRSLKSDFVRSTVKHHITNILYQAEIGRFDPTSTQQTFTLHILPSDT